MPSVEKKSIRKKCLLCKRVKRILLFPYYLFWRGYLFTAVYHIIFSRPSMQKLNERVLNMALRARGFNNCCNIRTTGEYAFLKIIKRKSPRICIDIGANKGNYARAILQMTNSAVISFEPLPQAFSELSQLQEEFKNRFEAVNVGLGQKNEILDLYYGDGETELSSYSAEINEIDYVGNNNNKSIKSEIITLDSYCEQKLSGRYEEIDLIKIDVEGMEYEVLIGAKETIKKFKPRYIQVEFNLHQLFRNQPMLNLGRLLPGYNLYQILPYGSCLSIRNIKSASSNMFYYSNFVFIRSDIRI